MNTSRGKKRDNNESEREATCEKEKRSEREATSQREAGQRVTERRVDE